MADIKLHGSWSSPYSDRVIWALKLKGLDYEFIQEDLSNKSDLLLKYNPVHKKVPVLVHHGKPLAESLVILQYIDETWPDNYPLLPTDGYDRAVARFWIAFLDNMAPTIRPIFGATGEVLENATKETVKLLKVLEEKGLGDKKFFGGDTIDMVDLAYGFLAYWFTALEDAVGVKVIDPNTLPKLHAWTLNFKEVPVVKETIPDDEKTVAHLKEIRSRITGGH